MPEPVGGEQPFPIGSAARVSCVLYVVCFVALPCGSRVAPVASGFVALDVAVAFIAIGPIEFLVSFF